jgi:hypothetical protein
MSKQQWEEEAIARFILFLHNEANKKYGVSGRDVPVQSGQNFDYELTDNEGGKCAVELFRLVDSEDKLSHSTSWEDVVTNLKEEMCRRELKGYLVSTPSFYYKKKDLASFVFKEADKIENAINNNCADEKFEQDGYEFNKLADLDKIVFSFSSGVRSINPVGTALESLNRLLPKKNGQLGVEACNKVLLIVNWAIFVDMNDMVNALTKIDFNILKNIDLIYYEINPSEFCLIFDRKVFDAISEKRILLEENQLNLIVSNLKYMLAEREGLAFDYVKTVTENEGNIDWLQDTAVKENLIHFAEYRLVDFKSLDETLWVINYLNNDNDPDKNGLNDADDPDGRYNYHQQIIRNEDVRTITTVRGHLCWLMRLVIASNKPELYAQIISIIERYLKEDNLYIRLQAIIPLTELVRRIKAVKNEDGTPFNWSDGERKRVRELAFEVLRDNTKYQVVMRGVLHLFGYLRQLNEEEALEVINTFLQFDNEDVMRDFAALVIYFALFRKNDWVDDGVFDCTEFVLILKNQIVSGNDKLRGSIAWHLWKILDDNELPYDVVKEYIFLFNEGDYNDHVLSMLALSVEKIISISPQDAISLYVGIIQKIKDYLNADPKNVHWWINSTEEILPLLAAHPDMLLKIISDLKYLWQRGVHIGDPKVFFEIYRDVEQSRREEVKKELQSFYGEMLKSYPTLVNIDWQV